MPTYCVNKNAQADGYYEVHDVTCSSAPNIVNQQPLGWYSSCSEAIKAAKGYYPTVDACKICSRECHTR
jgi:hypothetical protein